MAYSEPFIATTGMIISSSAHNTSYRGNIRYLKGKDGTIAFEAGASFAGGLVVDGGASFNGSLTVIGDLGVGTINLGTGDRVRFPTEVGFKIDLTSSGDSVGIGVATSTLYYKADGNHQWRDQNDNERMKLTTGATPVLTVGGVQVAKLDSANFTALQRGGQSVATLDSADFTVLRRGGNDVLTTASVLALPVSGTYTGTGTTSAIQIATGFVPKLVIITGGTSNANLANLHIHSPSGCLYQDNAGNIAWDTTSGRLHGSDGFTVANGTARANASGVVYTYTAFR